MKYDTGYGRDNHPSRGQDRHIGGKAKVCPSCSIGEKPRHCLFYTAAGRLTRYAFVCGYIEQRQDSSLSLQHGVFTVSGLRDGKQISQCFEGLVAARHFFRHFPKKKNLF